MHIYSLHTYSTHEHLCSKTHMSSFHIQHVRHLHTKHIHTRHCCPCSLPPGGSQASWAPSWIGGREAEPGTGECSAGPWSLMSAQAMNTPENSFRELVHLLGAGEGGIYAPDKVARVSGPRYVWPCTISQGRGVGRCFIYILRGCRVGDRGNLIRSNK